MAETDMVTQQEFKGRKELCNERNTTTNARLRSIDERLDRAALNLEKTAEILNRMSETQDDHEQRIRGAERCGATISQVEETIQDHEERLRNIEQRRGNWLDKIITAAIGVVVTIVVGILLYGKITQ